MMFLSRVRIFFVSKSKDKKSYLMDTALIDKFKSQKIHHIPNKSVPVPHLRNVLITAALPYVNNTPHLGNIIGAVLSADVFARYCRLSGYNVLYICGTDEYGTATEIKAMQQKKTPQQICNEFQAIHRNIYDWFNISFDYFGRTSQPVHTKITQQIFKSILINGHLREKQIVQFRCDNCSMFLADRFVKGICHKCNANARGDQCDNCSTIFNEPTKELLHPRCEICGSEPIPTATTHLFLSYDNVKEALKKWLLQQNTMKHWSNAAKGVTKGWLNSKNQDRCITRDLHWGVPVPLDNYQNKVFYVWFDAPIGYISMTADLLGEEYLKWWQKNETAEVELVQFMGKDNILFHSIMAPACLEAAQQNWIKPKLLAVTEYLRYEGGKFSKSKNIGIFADACAETSIPSDVWRYYLLSNRPQGIDSEFTWQDFSSKANRQLMNSIGNLFNRVLKNSYRQYSSRVPSVNIAQLSPIEDKLIEQCDQYNLKLRQLMEKAQLKSAIDLLLKWSFTINKYIQDTEFWGEKERKQTLIGLLVRCFRVYSLMLQPFLPVTAAKVDYLLGISHDSGNGVYQRMANMRQFIMNCLDNSTGMVEPLVLFAQITDKQIRQYSARFGTNSSSNS